MTALNGGAAAADGPETVKVFVFAGQSNMVGSDAHAERIDDYPMFRGAGEAQDDVLYSFLPEKKEEAFAGWGPLQARDSFGPELTFARLVKSHDASRIAIIKSAIGGTTVASDWNPDAPESGQKLYPRTLRLIEDSLRDLKKRGLNYKVEGVMWHQGENDMLDPKLNIRYAAGLTRLIAGFRKDLQLPQLKWFIGEVSEKGIWGMDNRRNLAVLRQQQDAVIKADPLLRWVPTSHLAFEVMGNGQPHYHFGTEGQLQMGHAFAAAWLESIGNPMIVPDREFRDALPVPPKTPIRLFVLAGQRTMEGEDSFVAEIPQQSGFESCAKDRGGILYRYSLGGGVKVSRAWEPLGPVDFLGNFGPELSFGASLQKSSVGAEGIAIVKFTHSGAQGPDWSPAGSPESRRNLYAGFVAFIREAREDLARRGYACALEGVFWHPGENDTWFEPYSRQYAGWMKELIAKVRVDVDAPALPWFISEQPEDSIWGKSVAVNRDLNAMAQSGTGIVIIKSAHLPHGRVQLGTKGNLLLGEEYARGYLQSMHP